MSEDKINAGIQQALKKMRHRRKPVAEDVAQEAREAKVSLETNISCVAQIDVPTNSERHRVAFQLLRASMDYGRALILLLETHPVDLSVIALAMHRSQIEQLLRAVFVQFLADEEQFEDFLQEDMGPRKKTQKGKWAPIAFKDLAVDVETAIARMGQDDGPQKLARLVINSWGPLCGLVHGGKAIRALYQGQNGKICAHVPADILFQTTVNAVATTNLCLIVALTAVGVGAFEENSLVERGAEEMMRYMRRRTSRIAELALRP